MALPYVVYPSADGSQSAYTLPFQYLATAHVKATVDGVDAPFTFTSTSIITFDTPPNGYLRIFRETPTGDLINEYFDGSVLIDDNLNASFTQALFVNEEARVLVEGSLYEDEFGVFDALNKRIKNVADPIDAGDVVNRLWAETSMSSQLALATDRAAAALASQNAAAASASTASTQAGIATTKASEAAASESAATTKASEAAASADAASTDASTATTKASEASASASAAAGSASDAAGSASDAAGSAATATTKAAEASASAAAAALSEANAAISAASVDMTAILDAIASGGVPLGASIYWNSTTVPTGFLKENGAAISRTTYADLFAIIGTTFGAGDGSTTFNVPDSRGMFLRGLDDGRAVDPGRGLAGYQADQNKSHTHTGYTNTTGNHRHGSGGLSLGGGQGGYNGSSGSGNFWTSYAGNHSHTVTTYASGGSEARPINVAKLVLIRAY